MSTQLEQILANLDKPGVTEIVMAIGRQVVMRQNGAYVQLSPRPLTMSMLTALLEGSAISPLIPWEDASPAPAEVEIGRRKLKVRTGRRGDEVVVRIEQLELRAGSGPIARTKTGSRAKGATTAPRTKSGATTAPRTKSGATRAPATKPIELELELDAPPPRGKSATTAPRAKTGATRAPATTMRAKTGATRAPATRGIDLDAPTGRKKGATAAPRTRSKLGLGKPNVEEFDLGDANLELSLDDAATNAPSTGFVAAGPNPDLDLDAAELDSLEVVMPSKPVATRLASPIGERAATAAPRAVAAVAPRPVAAAPDLAKPAGLVSATTRPQSAQFGKLVAAARAAGASDLHIATGRVIAMRVNTELVPVEPNSAQPLAADAAEAILVPLLGAEHQVRLEAVGYVDLAVEAPGGGRLRANISRHQVGLKGTFRLALDKPRTLDELGLPKELAKVVSHHQGFVVIAGPSGHGKTSTLAALVDLVNSTKPYHILTVEDPIEIEHPRKVAVVSQREAGRHTKNFASALKASLREDPDVIVIGELRDRESVEIALTAAETGHLVLTTMSTPSAAKTLDRLIDMFPPAEHQQVRASIAGALRAIVAQRLIPKVGGGVVPAIELVTGVLPLAVLIRDDKLFQLPNLMQRGHAFGMIRFDESLIALAKAGKITNDTALAWAENKKELAPRLSK